MKQAVEQSFSHGFERVVVLVDALRRWEVGAQVIVECEELEGVIELLEDRTGAFQAVEELSLCIVVEDGELEFMGILVGDE